jgi:hypothetical protein
MLHEVQGDLKVWLVMLEKWQKQWNVRLQFKRRR